MTPHIAGRRTIDYVLFLDFFTKTGSFPRVLHVHSYKPTSFAQHASSSWTPGKPLEHTRSGVGIIEGIMVGTIVSLMVGLGVVGSSAMAHDTVFERV